MLFWCHTLEAYYNERSDEQASPLDFGKANKYRSLRILLEYRCETGNFPEEINAQAFKISLGKQLGNSFQDLMDTIQHTSLIRGWLGFVNFYRILFLFSRFAIKKWLNAGSPTTVAR